MNIKRKLMMLGCTLATCVTMGATPAFAQTEDFINWTIASTASNDTRDTLAGYKNDNEQNYYLTITIGNVSSSNVFGTRIRKANGSVSNYVIHKSYMTSKPFAYTSTVNMSEKYFMRGKKTVAAQQHRL